jgi:hypothetical protein
MVNKTNAKKSEKFNVIWKRPDGFHGASPSDFKVVTLGNHLKLWLHHKDNINFPFRISGGWQEEVATSRLNKLVNLLDKPEAAWKTAITKIFDDTMGDHLGKHLSELVEWITELRSHLKGDTWEVEIMNQALTDVTNQLSRLQKATI